MLLYLANDDDFRATIIPVCCDHLAFCSGRRKGRSLQFVVFVVDYKEMGGRRRVWF